MLPDWDFADDDAKRRDFIAWVNAEMDRFAVMVTERLKPRTDDPGVDWQAILRTAKHPVGRPGNPVAGLNGLVWEYALIRFMFDRYWPGRKRSVGDPANALNIAVMRNRDPLPRSRRTSDRLKAFDEQGHKLADKLLQEWNRGSKSVGRQMALDDIAYLKALPDYLFPE